MPSGKEKKGENKKGKTSERGTPKRTPKSSSGGVKTKSSGGVKTKPPTRAVAAPAPKAAKQGPIYGDYGVNPGAYQGPIGPGPYQSPPIYPNSSYQPPPIGSSNFYQPPPIYPSSYQASPPVYTSPTLTGTSPSYSVLIGPPNLIFTPNDCGSGLFVNDGSSLLREPAPSTPGTGYLTGSINFGVSEPYSGTVTILWDLTAVFGPTFTITSFSPINATSVLGRGVTSTNAQVALAPGGHGFQFTFQVIGWDPLALLQLNHLISVSYTV